MRIALLFIAIGLVGAEVFKQLLQRQLSRWTEPQFLQEQQQPPSEKKNRACARHAEKSCSRKTTIAPEKLFSFHDTIYSTVITMGTPPQNFTVVIDTGSTLLWIVSESNCNTRECIGEAEGYTRHRFNTTASSTFNQTESPFLITYMKGAVAGFYARDDLSMGGLNVTGQEFGIAYRLNDDFRAMPWDGILGLAWPQLKNDGVVPPFQSIMDQLDEPIFTIFLDHQVSSQTGTVGGQVTYGGYDTEHCEKEIDYVPLTEKSYWQFAVDGFSVGNYSSSFKTIAVSDTGSTLIGGPPDAVNAIFAATNATLDLQSGLHWVPCDGVYPPLRFTIGGKQFDIEPREYILKFETNFFYRFFGAHECFIAVEKMAGFGFGATWLLGEPFVRQYCIVHDVGQARVGLAKAIHPVSV